MKANEGAADRAVRFILGAVALVAAWVWLGVMEGAILGIVVAAAGVVLVVTAAVGFCPAYKICDMSTCAVKQA